MSINHQMVKLSTAVNVPSCCIICQKNNQHSLVFARSYENKTKHFNFQSFLTIFNGTDFAAIKIFVVKKETFSFTIWE